jgi:hypothetical protein
MCIIFSVVKLESISIIKKTGYGFVWHRGDEFKDYSWNGSKPLLTWSCVSTSSHGYAFITLQY